MTDPYKIIQGDCQEQLSRLEANSVDSVVTDPPYGLKFMGKKWDHGVPSIGVWKQILRVLKPGGHLLSFAGTRTHHRMACNIEDAGFDIRDMVAWMYGSGFPKSHNISKAIDKAARGVPHGGADPTSPNHGKYKGGCSEENPTGQGFGAGPGQFMEEQGEQTERELAPTALQWDGWGTALKPAFEPITVARKPFKGTVANNVLEHGTGGLNIDDCRVPLNGDYKCASNGRPSLTGLGDNYDADTANKHTEQGRWPANLIHDGSDEVLEQFPASKGQQGSVKGTEPSHTGGEGTNCYGEYARTTAFAKRGDTGTAARFFYCSKANKKDRGEDNNHPTVKPTDLMRYLCRLVTPQGGIVLDPFMGSGSTGKACMLEGFRFIGCELDSLYCSVAVGRMNKVLEGSND